MFELQVIEQEVMRKYLVRISVLLVVACDFLKGLTVTELNSSSFALFRNNSKFLWRS
jgi:hypothetical protein